MTCTEFLKSGASNDSAVKSSDASDQYGVDENSDCVGSSIDKETDDNDNTLQHSCQVTTRATTTDNKSTGKLTCNGTTEGKDAGFSVVRDEECVDRTSKALECCKVKEEDDDVKDGKKKDMKEIKEDEEEEEDVLKHDDMDRGWAFMIVFATFNILLLVAILGPGFGILFSDFLREMKASSTVTTVIFNSESFSWSISNLLAGPLTEQFGWRPVGMVGGLMCCIGMLSSAFAPSPEFLFFSHSILTGFGSGSACLAAFAVIPNYFKRMLGRAQGITTAGLCVGGMIGPPLVTFLQEKLGFRGATLIVSGMALNICLAAATFRPIPKSSTKPKESAGGSCQAMGRMVRTLGRNCMLMRSPRVIIIAVGGSFVVGIFLNMFLLVPFVMEAKGHTLDVAAWCISIANLCNLLTRLAVSSCSDFQWFSVLWSYIFFAFFLAISVIAFGFLEDIALVTVALAVYGSCSGACMSLYSLIMMKYMGLKLYIGVFGVAGIVNGLWMLCCGPLIGLISDWSGSYTLSLCVLGSSGFLAAFLFLLMPLAVAHDKRKEDHQRTKDAEMMGG